MHKIVIIIHFISLNIYFECSKELSHWGGSFEYPEDMFWLRNKKTNFNYALLSAGPYHTAKTYQTLTVLITRPSDFSLGTSFCHFVGLVILELNTIFDL